MALMSISVKRHLVDDFPISPPPPPPQQSSVFLSTSLPLLTNREPLPVNPPRKKFRKPDLFRASAESSFSAAEEWATEPSAGEAKVLLRVGERDVVSGTSDGVGQLQGIRDDPLATDQVDNGCDKGSNFTETPDPDPEAEDNGSMTMDNYQRAPTGNGEEQRESSDPLIEEICPDCGKAFKRRIYLQRHVAREHRSLAKVFRCDRCVYETKHQSNLLVHRRTHTGERPYHCGACGQSYTQGHLLKAHIRSRHGADMRLYNMDRRTDCVRHRQPLAGPAKEGGRMRFALAGTVPSQSLPVFGGSSAIGSPSADRYANFLSCLPGGLRDLRPVLWSSLSRELFSVSPTDVGLSAILSLVGNNVLSTTAAGSLLSSVLARPNSCYAAPIQAVESDISKGVSSAGPTRSAAQESGDAGAAGPATTPEDLTTKKRLAERVASTVNKRSCQKIDGEIDLIRKDTFKILPSSPAVSLGHRNDLGFALALSDRGMDPNQGLFISRSGGDLKHLPDDPLRVFPSHNGRKLGSTIASSRQPNNENVTLTWSNTRSEAFSGTSQPRIIPDDTNLWFRDQLSTSRLQLSSATTHNKDSICYNSTPTKSTLQESAGVPPTPTVLGSSVTEAQAVRSSCPSESSSSTAASCREASCPYLKKLKDLRRNVYRMLSVFTPYLGADDINDNEADSIDEFLHEVIYSKSDDTQ